MKAGMGEMAGKAAEKGEQVGQMINKIQTDYDTN